MYCILETVRLNQQNNNMGETGFESLRILKSISYY